MVDNLTKPQRSALMAKVRSKNTRLEIVVFDALTAAGVPFERHVRSLPGSPDIVMTDARVVVFVDGDFWHGWHFPKWERKLQPQWREKIAQNRCRDRRTFAALRRSGWTVIRIWQHDVERDLERVVARLVHARKNAPKAAAVQEMRSRRSISGRHSVGQPRRADPAQPKPRRLKPSRRKAGS